MRNITLGLLALSLAACQGEVGTKPADVPSEAPAKLDAAAIHAQTLTLDTHIDIPLTYMTEIDPSGETELQVDLPKLAEGKLDSGFWIIYTPQGELTVEGYAGGLEIAQTRMDAITALVNTHKDNFELAKTAADVVRIVEMGKHAVLIGMENAYPLSGLRPIHDDGLNEVELLEMAVQNVKDAGVRYMGITHFGHNQFGDSSNPNPLRDDGPKWNGLSPLGKTLVAAMNDNGIMVDVSHAGKETMMQAADLSRTPIIASHSGVKAVGDSARNLDDEQLRKIKQVGGVAQMVALGAYVKPMSEAQLAFREDIRKSLGLMNDKDLANMSEEVKAKYNALLKPMFDMESPASVADFVDHIDHAVEVAGIDSVGIASDFDGGGGIEGWKDASETQNVTAELVKRGYSEADIAKIWGGNLLRVMEVAEVGAK